ncbi:MAG: hypothetical protein H0X51_07235 [Parachlamydiaceae bacterium]|nr:hypothetical protein [Parachlamydiaceae bacterium]
MALLNRANRLVDEAGSSFEETYKTSYSHGLEAIYALENVDLKSIRRIEVASPTTQSVTTNKKAITPSTVQQQLEFDLGAEFKTWIPSFLNKEPIQVLELSPLAERCLMAHGKTILQDLLQTNFQSFLTLKGMGQGLLDEMRQKLHTYVAGRSTERCEEIDFASWMRTLLAGLERKKAFVLLQHHGLGDLIHLSTMEMAEVGRLSFEKKQEWIRDIGSQLQTSARKQICMNGLEAVCNAFIKPWMRSRLGLATIHELTEAVQCMSLDPQHATEAMRFLSATYFDHQFPLKHLLHEVAPNLYSSDHHTSCDYRSIEEKALSYFYHPSVHYPLSHLILLIEREFACAWVGFPEGLIEKVLKKSPSLRVRKEGNHVLTVRLS